MDIQFDILLGKTLTDVKVIGKEEIHFYADHERYILTHFQDCCENVYIESIIGDLNELIGSPITLAEEVSNNYYSNDHAKLLHALMGPLPGSDESYTWTFYKLATVKGYVDIRWYGTSNGYYSESVSFYKVEN